jgi:hypothetical protein
VSKKREAEAIRDWPSSESNEGARADRLRQGTRAPVDGDKPAMRAFARYALTCSDEKGDAQVFCDRLFKALGHAGYEETGATLENRIRMGGGVKYARPRVEASRSH